MSERISFELLSDLEILAEACKGDRACFEALMHRYYHLIYNVAFRLRGDRAEALEATHATLARVARSIRAFNTTARFRAWLYRLVLKVDAEMSSRSKKERKGQKKHRDYSAERPDDGLALAALDTLGRLERRTVVFMVYEGLSAAQVAEILGCAESTILWRMFKARRKLRAEMGGLQIPSVEEAP